MLKKLTLIIAAVTATASLFAQGTVNFNTLNIGARVYDGAVDANGGTAGALVGNAGGAQLYAALGAGAADSALQAIGSRVNFRAGDNAGYTQVAGKNKWGETVSAAVKVPGTLDEDGKRAATIQMRAWDAAFDNYDAAVKGKGKSGFSKSIVVTVGFPPGTPPDLVGADKKGFPSFGIIPAVPEPSTIALSVLGVGALLALRRRK